MWGWRLLCIVVSRGGTAELARTCRYILSVLGIASLVSCNSQQSVYLLSIRLASIGGDVVSVLVMVEI